MDSDDSVGRDFRKGKRVIKIPLNGCQKIEFKNITKEDVSVDATLHSLRFSILNSRMTSDENRFKVVIPPDNSIVIVIKDMGHVKTDKWERPTYHFEGVLNVEVKEARESILLDTDPKTDSYRKLRTYEDSQADCGFFDFGMCDKVKNFLLIEPISDDKYGKGLPNNVKTLELNADDRRHNSQMRKLHTINRIAAINRFMGPDEYKKALDICAKEEELLRKGQQEYQASAALESKRSEKSDVKSLSHDQLTSVASQSKKSEKSEAKSMTENPKSTVKSEKTTKSEMVQKSEKEDPVGRKFRKGKRVIKIPLNGSQKIEIKNIIKEDISLDVGLHSSRFSILNCRKTSFRDFYKADLSPDNSIVIVIKDNGHVDMNKILPTYIFEGVFRVTVKEISQSIFLIPDPDTESFKELRLYRDRHADCELLELHNGEVEEFVSIEPISDSKYGETLPNNVKMLRMNEGDRRHNFKMVEADTMSRIAAINPFLDPSEYKKSLDIIAKEDERHWTNQKESNKSHPSSAAPESKRSVTSEKSDAKSLRSDQLTSVASQLERSEKSEAKSMTENSKSTVKSEKTIKSEMVQKSKKVDLPELKNEEKKKRKKKKRCVIC
ncbi:hypothetical protein CAEBREN_04479 [Caenorhabditis brenneri]|uniref:Uncharacterized protein n=1 Tax=Caenorhabditis brenneri TaxID=135651 RepID=G0NDL5_CAEBE|nr:hypothetical protein CAEBREN_04479 [Caenorhabditis brenneri]